MKLHPTLAACLAAAALALPSAAHADAVVSTTTEIAHAIAAEPAAPPADDLSGISVPASGTADVAVGGLTLGLPAEGAVDVHGETAVYRSDESSQAQVAVQAVDGGVRALVNIDSAAAPERYDFALGGNVATLAAQPDGSVLTFDADGIQTGTVAAPWARDANGTPVPTRFEINGTTLTQVVDHVGGDFEYGVTADPVWIPAAVAIRACIAVRCYRWMPNFVLRQWQVNPNAHIVIEWIRNALF